MNTNIEERYNILNAHLFKHGIEVMHAGGEVLGFSIIHSNLSLSIYDGVTWNLLNSYLLDGKGNAKTVAEQVRQHIHIGK